MSQLTDTDRDRIMQLLAANQPLPASDRELLFPSSVDTSPQEPEQAPEPEPNVPSENWLCFSLYSASLAVGKTYWPFLEKYGLTYPQLLALRHLQDGITVNELGSLIFLDSGTLTPLLKRLEGAGHIRRERDPKDERRVRLYLTEGGQKIRDEAVNTLRMVLPNTSGWKRRDLHTLARQITQFRSDLLDTQSQNAEPPATE